MTFGEAIFKTCVIGDFERSAYTKSQYAAFADMAQKMLAGAVLKNINIYTVSVSEKIGEFELPPDFKRFVRIKRKNSDGAVNFELTGTRLCIFGNGDYDVFYEAVPGDVTASTPDDYVFEIPKYAHFAIPYYICYQLLKSTDTDCAQTCLNEWNRLLSVLGDDGSSVCRKITDYYN